MGESTDAVGICAEPMTDEELAAIKERIADHGDCSPGCEQTPSAKETLRLLATIDEQCKFIEIGLAKYNEGALALCEEIGAKQLRVGAETMRSACSAMLRSLASEARAAGGLKSVVHVMANEYAASIDALPLPDAPVQKMPLATWSPAPGVRGTVLYQADGVLVGRVTLEPGAEVPREVHEECERIVVVAGALLIKIELLPLPIELYVCHASPTPDIKPGHAHAIRNASATEPAEYIAVVRRV